MHGRAGYNPQFNGFALASECMRRGIRRIGHGGAFKDQASGEQQHRSQTAAFVLGMMFPVIAALVLFQGEVVAMTVVEQVLKKLRCACLQAARIHNVRSIVDDARVDINLPQTGRRRHLLPPLRSVGNPGKPIEDGENHVSGSVLLSCRAQGAMKLAPKDRRQSRRQWGRTEEV